MDSRACKYSHPLTGLRPPKLSREISKFGGDPAKVTIHGQSAGAGSVLQHVVANGGNTQPPLFRAAMLSSPFLPFQYEFNDPIWEVCCALSYVRAVAQACTEHLLESDLPNGVRVIPVCIGSILTDQWTAAMGRSHVSALSTQQLSTMLPTSLSRETSLASSRSSRSLTGALLSSVPPSHSARRSIILCDPSCIVLFLR
jgi:carboxylesterase type B